MSRCSVITTGHLRTDHIAGLEALHGRVTVDRRCADLAEVIAVARTSRADAALIIGGTEPLTRTVVSELRGLGVTVVAVSEVPAERSRLADLMVTALPDDVSADQLAGALDRPASSVALPPPPPPGGEVLAAWEQERPPPSDGMPEEGPDPVEEDPAEEDTAAEAPEAETPQSETPQSEALSRRRRRGARVEPSVATPPGITVVWGSQGSPGRTTVAVNLAAELAGAGKGVLLVDADTTASSAAAHLGLLEEAAGLAQACRQAELGRLDAGGLRRAVTAVEISSGRLHLLTGLPRADRWPELREAGLRQVLQTVRGLYDHVVVDTAASVEQDEELTYDTHAPQRHAATLCALEEADRLILLGAADAVGFARTVRALEELATKVPGAPDPEVVISKVRSAAVGRSPRHQLREAWSRFCGGRPLAGFLPWDPEACDAALLRGQAFAEAVPESGLRRAVAELAGVTLPQRRRRLILGASETSQARSLPRRQRVV